MSRAGVDMNASHGRSRLGLFAAALALAALACGEPKRASSGGHDESSDDASTSHREKKSRPSAAASGKAALVGSGLVRSEPVPSARMIDARSHVVIAGVLSWSDPGFKPFSAAGRKDRELADRLVADLGVPKDEVALLLDKQATRAAILAAVAAAAAKTKPGETLVFYYAGHGTRDAKGTVFLAPSDVDSAHLEDTGLSMAALTQALTKLPSGARLLLLGDSCYSGALASVAEGLGQRGVSAAAITSAEASNTSTVNWTFTQTVLDVITGSPLADRDKSGAITLSELASEERDAMKYMDRQRAGVALQTLAAAQIAAAKAQPAAPAGLKAVSLGEYVTVGTDTTVYRLVGQRGGDALLRTLNYATLSERSAAVSELRPIQFRTWPVGAEIDVSWGGKLWDAKVIDASQDGFMRITYVGWPAYWDEWVLDDRVAEKKKGAKPRR